MFTIKVDHFGFSFGINSGLIYAFGQIIYSGSFFNGANGQSMKPNSSSPSSSTSDSSAFHQSKCPYTRGNISDIIVIIFILLVIALTFLFLWKKKLLSLSGNNRLIRDVESAKPSNGNLYNEESSILLTNQSTIMTKPEQVQVKKTDCIGLGFNITGNMSDGIFIKDVGSRGPANTSRLIKDGDQIKSIMIEFENMSHEDALAILRDVSPHDVTFQIERTTQNAKLSYFLHKISGDHLHYIENSGFIFQASPSSTSDKNFESIPGETAIEFNRKARSADVSSKTVNYAEKKKVDKLDSTSIASAADKKKVTFLV